MVDQFRHRGIGLDQVVGKLDRVRGGIADAIDAVDGGDIVNQQREIGDLAVVHDAAVGVDILSQQVDFAHALLGQAGDLGQHVVERPADFFAAGIGYDTETAVLAAALHDRHESLDAVGARLGQVVEFFDFGKTDVDHRTPGGARFTQHLRQAMQGLWTEHHVDVGRAGSNCVAFLARDTATNADDHVRPGLFELLPAPELGKHLFLRLFANRTGVEQQHVGLGLIVGRQQVAALGQHVQHLGRIVLVHLAAVGLDEYFTAHARILTKSAQHTRCSARNPVI